MKKIVFLAKTAFIVLSMLSAITASASDKFKLEDFSMRLEQSTALPIHIWVSSGYTTVSPIYETVTGVNEFFSPPFAARKFNMHVTVTADSLQLPDDATYWNKGIRYADGEWFPHKIVRNGTHHRLINGRLISLGVISELIPLFGQSGFIEKITYTNRATTPVQLKVTPSINPGTPTVHPLNNWTYQVPGSKTAQAEESAPNRWSNEAVNVGLYVHNESKTLQPGESLETTITVVMVKKDDILPEKVDDKALINTSVEAWQNRLDTYTKNIPSLTTDIDGLSDYYKRALLTGLVCIWENPAFKPNPFLASLGMDGGGICTYLWDTGYSPYMVSLMLGAKARDLVKHMSLMDVNKNLAFSPAGTSYGGKYTYSTVAFIKMVDGFFRFHAPDNELFDCAKRLILSNEERKLPNGLIDCGTNSNMLELHSAGWEHLVVSPNAERNWCLNRLAEMGKYMGASPTEMNEWKQQGERVIEAIRKELWDEEKQWFASIYPDGFKDYLYSIQVFDAMWAGACTPAMEKVLVAELNDKSFLGSHGVASISKKDRLHYEYHDDDWGGSGAYAGDGPQTALIMYGKGYPEAGWDILRRHFWMGKQCLFFPQDFYSDRPSASTIGPGLTRSNVVAGFCGTEAILFGLIGFQPQYDGTLFINPQVTVDGKISIKGFVYRDNTFDVEVSSSKLTVIRNGKTIYKGKAKQVKIL
jgi:hypothetical protein